MECVGIDPQRTSDALIRIVKEAVPNWPVGCNLTKDEFRDVMTYLGVRTDMAPSYWRAYMLSHDQPLHLSMPYETLLRGCILSDNSLAFNLSSVHGAARLLAIFYFGCESMENSRPCDMRWSADDLKRILLMTDGSVITNEEIATLEKEGSSLVDHFRQKQKTVLDLQVSRVVTNLGLENNATVSVNFADLSALVLHQKFRGTSRVMRCNKFSLE